MSRVIDSGAVFGGWVGVGMGVVVAIAFELIIPVQTIVFLLAPIMGALVGVYANVRSERWRPRARVLANAAYASFVAGLALALLYVIVRLVFIYGDTGSMPDGSTLPCTNGPDCIFQRYVNSGELDELTSVGIYSPAELESAMWRELFTFGTSLIVLSVAGGLVGGTIRSFSSPPRPAPLPVSPGAARPRPQSSS